MRILVDRVCRGTKGLIDDEQGGFRLVRKHEKKNVGVMDLKAYDRLNRESLWQLLRMYVGGKPSNVC